MSEGRCNAVMSEGRCKAVMSEGRCNVERIEKCGFADLLPYLLENRPVIITKEAAVTKDWRVDASFFLDPQYSPLVMNDVKIPVDISIGSSSVVTRSTMTYDVFLSRLLHASDNDEILYGKDFHLDALLFGSIEEQEKFYLVPDCFKDDWLNDYCQWKRIQDYKFAYIGGKASFTHLHHDVLASFSWSINLSGIKYWCLWSPDESNDNDDDLDVDLNAPMYAFEQHSGEAVFVPSGWYHSVGNSQDELTVSINRNWFNAFSIVKVFEFLIKEWNLVKNELSHLLTPSSKEKDVEFKDQMTQFSSSCVRMSFVEWSLQCESIMQANAAMNWLVFLELLSSKLVLYDTVCYKNLAQVKEGEIEEPKPVWCTLFCPHYCPRTFLQRRDYELVEQQQIATIGKDGTSVWIFTCAQISRVLKLMMQHELLIIHIAIIFGKTAEEIIYQLKTMERKIQELSRMRNSFL